MNGSSTPPQRGGLPGNDSMAKRLMIVGGGLFALLLFIVLLFAMMSGGGGNRESLLSVAQYQQETARVAELITQGSSNQAVKNLATSIKLSRSSDSTELAAVLAARGISFDEKELLLGMNQETDTQLTTAKSAGLYDTAALEIMTTETEEYKNRLNNAYVSTENPETQAVLASQFQSAELLLSELKNTKL